MAYSQYSGVYNDRVLLQQRGSIGGHRYVFVKLQGGAKNELVFPTTGCRLMNPFKGLGKFFAGDLVEFRTGSDATSGTGYILKTFQVAKVVAAADVDVFIVRDGYKHVPFVGDILMKAPATLTGTGTSADIVSVVATTDGGKDVWKITFSGAIGALSAGDVLVEADGKGATKTMLVSNPNMVLPWDMDCLYAPATGDDDFDGARYLFTPVLSELAYEKKMSPIPPCVKALNRSRVVSWFKI